MIVVASHISSLKTLHLRMISGNFHSELFRLLGILASEADGRRQVDVYDGERFGL